MTLAPLLAAALLAGPVPSTSAASATPAAPAAPACRGVLDRTPTCAPPRVEAAPAVADAARKLEPKQIADPKALPGALALVAAGLGVGGGFALAASFAEAPGRQAPDQRVVNDVTRLGGYSLLTAAGLVGVASAAFSFFDPSTGELRFESIKQEGS